MLNTTPYQDIGYQVVQVMARRIRPDTPRPIVLGGLPVGAVVLGGVTQTIEPFENGGSFHVGTRHKPDTYGSLSLGAKGRSAFADKAEAVTAPTEVVISSPDDDTKESHATPAAGAHAKAESAHDKAESKAESAHDKDDKNAKNRAARAAEAKTRKPEPEPEEVKPVKGEAVVYLTFIVVR
jgi:hypothetical protein